MASSSRGHRTDYAPSRRTTQSGPSAWIWPTFAADPAVAMTVAPASLAHWTRAAATPPDAQTSTRSPRRDDPQAGSSCVPRGADHALPVAIAGGSSPGCSGISAWPDTDELVAAAPPGSPEDLEGLADVWPQRGALAAAATAASRLPGLRPDRSGIGAASTSVPAKSAPRTTGSSNGHWVPQHLRSRTRRTPPPSLPGSPLLPQALRIVALG